LKLALLMQQGERVIYIDETSCNTWCRSSKIWGPVGVLMPIQQTRGKPITIIAAIDWEVGLLHYSAFIGSNNGETFINFIQELYRKL